MPQPPGQAALPSRLPSWSSAIPPRFAFDYRLAEFDIQGSLAHAAMLHHVGVLSEARPGRHPSAAWRRSADGDSCAASSAGRSTWKTCISISRSALTALDRRRRQAPAHRPLAQRPGGDRYPPVPARRDRRASLGLLKALQTRAARPGRTARRHRHARLHPSAGGAAGDLRPSPDGLFRDAASATRERLRRLPQARQPPAAGRGRAGRHQLSDRPRVWSPNCWASTAVCENSLDAVSDRDFAIEFTAAAALIMTHLSRLSEELILWMSPRFGFIDLRRPLLHRLVDHAAEEEPRRAGTGARQDRPRERPPGGAADADERPAAGLQQGQPGRQGAAVRHRRHAGRHAARSSPTCCAGIDGQAGSHARGGARRAMPPPPTWPTIW